MAMRGDDVIGIRITEGAGQQISYIKVEAKSSKALSSDKLQKAREELDQNDGKPSTHALVFISDRIREHGNVKLADVILKSTLTHGIKNNQVKHLLFTLTQSPESLVENLLRITTATFPQKAIHFRIDNHQKMINDTYQEVLNGLN